MRDLLAIVPCKAFRFGKSRLDPVLTPQARAALCEEFLQATLSRLTALQPAPQVIVIAGDADVERTAHEAGVDAIRDTSPGLNPALEAARPQLHGLARRYLIMPTDLPLADESALARLLDGDAEVTLAPDRSGTGTNVLALSAHAFERFEFCYGVGSLDLHRAVAKRCGLSTRIVDDPALALDIDEPADLDLWRGGHVPPERVVEYHQKGIYA